MTSIDIESRLARRARGREPSPIRAIFPLLSLPGMISFGGGYPNPQTFPFSGLSLDFKGRSTLQTTGPELGTALQYGPSDGAPALVRHLIDWHQSKDGIRLDEERLVVLNGAQEGLFIAAYLFLEPDDSVALSEPTYPGALASFRAFSQRTVAVPLDEQGMDADYLERELEKLVRNGEKLPKFIYTIPSGHNPGGVALSPDRRNALLSIASRFDLLVLEDDPYQLVRMDDSPPPPTLQSLDQEGRVIRLDSFSKIFAPGLRIGYASGDPAVIRQFVLFKQYSNLHTSSMVQRILSVYLSEATPEGFKEEIKKNCRLYRDNRDAMVEAAKRLLPPTTRFNIPGEGLFIWFQLPENCDATRMIAEDSRSLKVVLVPGPAFSSIGGCKNCMRASYSMVDRSQIELGMERFAEMIAREQAR